MDFPQLTGYTFQSVLGQGGFGTTYLALHEASQSRCVIKALSFEHLKDWKTVELFEREAHTLRQLRHGRIPRHRDFIQDTHSEPAQFYLVQDYAPGQDLATCVAQGQRFQEEDIVNIALQITDILIYLQAQHPPLIHRDIKPSNLMLEGDQVYLIDFGAVTRTAPGERGSTMVGSLGYMAPEQFHGQAYAATDIYGLGVSLIFLMTRKEPSELSSGGFQLKFKHLLHCSRGLAEVLEKMVAPHHSERYPNAKALHQDLLLLQQGKAPGMLAIKAPTSETAAPASGGNTKHSIVLWGIIALLIAFIGVMALGRSERAERQRFNAIRNKIEKAYEETYRAEYGDPPRPVKIPE